MCIGTWQENTSWKQVVTCGYMWFHRLDNMNYIINIIIIIIIIIRIIIIITVLLLIFILLYYVVMMMIIPSDY